MRRDTDRCTLEPGRTALALRGLSKPSSYPLEEQHHWRTRAAGLFAALRALGGPGRQRQRELQARS
jgi:hypothetical protein